MINPKPLPNTVEGMIKRYNAIVESVELLDKKLKAKDATINLLLQEKAQWLQSKENWEKIVQQTLANSNQANLSVSNDIDRLTKENIELKEELKELRGR